MASKMHYSTPVGSRNSASMRCLRREGSGIVEFGRWMALREMAFEAGGVLDLSDRTMRVVVADELDMKESRLDGFIELLVRFGEVERALWEGLHHVVFPSVAKEVGWIRDQADAGRSGGRGKKKDDA